MKKALFLTIVLLIVVAAVSAAENRAIPFMTQWGWQGVEAVCGNCEQDGPPFPGFTWEYECTLDYTARPSPGVSLDRQLDLFNSFSNSSSLFYRMPWIDGPGWYSWEQLTCVTWMCPPEDDGRMCRAIEVFVNGELPQGPNPDGAWWMDGGVESWIPVMEK